jgi:predicted nucleotidyltransferase/DNA-binding XRE family transcriptional regulator
MELMAGAMIRQARRQARLSQTDLARRAGVAQSVISAYEANRREPSFPTLVKLVEATGHRLAVELMAPPPDQMGLPDSRLGRRVRQHRRAVKELAARRGARNARVFGSVARGEDTMNSDVDLLVDLDNGVGVVSLAGLRRELTELLGAAVDVVPASTLKPGVRDQILTEAIAL